MKYFNNCLIAWQKSNRFSIQRAFSLTFCGNFWHMAVEIDRALEITFMQSLFLLYKIVKVNNNAIKYSLSKIAAKNYPK